MIYSLIKDELELIFYKGVDHPLIELIFYKGVDHPLI
jgi:hypothetical protein